MKLARVFCFLIILASSAIAAYAQTPIDPSSVINDPHVVLNSPDPACPLGDYCVDLTYSTTHTGPVFVPVLTFLVPDPPGELPVPPAYSCSSNVFLLCLTDYSGFQGFKPTEFNGFTLLFGILYNGQTFILESTGPIQLELPSGFACNPASLCPDGVVTFSPEPGTALLFMTGLLLLSLVGFARKRFAANFRT